MKKIFTLFMIMFAFTTFANATELTAWGGDTAVWVTVKDKPNNYQDWIGIYPKNSSNDWNNVVAWKWARDGGPSPDDPNTDEYIFTDVDFGEYEARFFLNNTYKTEYKSAFNYVDRYKTSINITTATLEPNKAIEFNIGGYWALSGDDDWVGIYPKGASNDWNNVITWNWAKNTKVTLAGVSVGEYEARLFYHNSYISEASVPFMIKSSAGYAYPPETDFHPIPSDFSVAKPDQRGATVIDPQFGTTITRVTDYRVLDVNGASCTGHTEAKIQSWNADMSLLKVDFRLYDANTLEESPITKGLTCAGGYNKLGSPGQAFRWSYVDPKVFYTLGTDKTFYKNTINGTNTNREVVKSFSNYGFEKMQLGSNEGNMSHDDRYVIFTAKKPGNDHVFAVLLDIRNATAKVKELPNTTWGLVGIYDPDDGKYYKRALYDWITVTPKGNHIIENKTINGPQYVGQDLKEVPTGIFMYDMNFENSQRITLVGSHGDIGINSKGQQVWVQNEFGAKDGTWSYNLDTLEDIRVGTKLTSITSGHVGCQNYKRPGWCYLSPTRPGYGWREVLAVKLDGSGKVNRFAQSRFAGHPFGGPSPDGKRVVFQSNWNDGGRLDTFHAVLKTAP